MLIRAKEAYRSWHKCLVNLNRLDRYTIGARIDETFLIFIELIFRAGFANGKLEKHSILSQAINKCDLLNFFLQLAWEQKVIDHKNYSLLILFLDEIGRMLGGWKKSLQEKTPRWREKSNELRIQRRQLSSSQSFSKLPRLKFQSPSEF